MAVSHEERVDSVGPSLDPPAGGSGGLRRTLIAIVVVGALLIAGAAGYLIGHRGGSSGSGTPTATSVDAGFAWDMSVHHRQAVSMAGYTRDHTADPQIRSLAYDIETSQFNQVGQMQGWIDTWSLPVANPGTQMAWMAGDHGMSGHSMLESNGLMPGMATPAELDALQKLTGKALDVRFLQLMLRHHQGGVPMAQYAAAHASEPYVRNAAQKMADAQGAEIVLMEQMLRSRGASPLPPPA